MDLSELTKEQCDAIVSIGSPSSDPVALPQDVLDGLHQLGILTLSAPDNIDLTSVGDALYHKLASSADH